MCGHAKFGKKRYEPGMVLPIITSKGLVNAVWGLNRFHNARAETMYEVWKPYSFAQNRCILEVSEFTEGLGIFKLPNSQIIRLGGITNNSCSEFALLTIRSSPQVMKFHHRMPVIINSDAVNLFFLTSNYIDFNSQLFRPELELKRIINTK